MYSSVLFVVIFPALFDVLRCWFVVCQLHLIVSFCRSIELWRVVIIMLKNLFMLWWHGDRHIRQRSLLCLSVHQMPYNANRFHSHLVQCLAGLHDPSTRSFSKGNNSWTRPCQTRLDWRPSPLRRTQAPPLRKNETFLGALAPWKCCKVFCALVVTVKTCVLRVTTKKVTFLHPWILPPP